MSHPSLYSLKVFESVARLGRLAAASAELHVTAGAISHQIRKLQEQLGVKLFEKRGQSLILTDRGKVLEKSVAQAMSEISQGLRQVLSDELIDARETILRLSLPPTLTATWMCPRLFRFLENHQNIRLHVEAASTFDEVDWRNTDAAVIYGNPPWPGFWSRLLHGIRLTPVCSPQLLRGPKGIRKPSDVVNHRLLHEDDGSEWQRWLAHARVENPGRADVYFSDFGVVVQAACDGDGVALIDDVISARALDQGQLVQPLSLSIPAAENYHCICAQERMSSPAVRRFMDWLIQEADAGLLS